MGLERGWIQRVEGGCFQEEGQREGKGLLSKLRLKKREFLYIIKNGRYKTKGCLTLYLLKNKKNGLGISISRKIKGVVFRNKIKRRIREICWKNRKKIPKNSQIVIIVHSGLKEASYSSLEALFLSLLEGIKNG